MSRADLFQLVQIVYWLALATWFGGVLFVAMARALGLPVKLHADQLSDLGGAALAAITAASASNHTRRSQGLKDPAARASTHAIEQPMNSPSRII